MPIRHITVLNGKPFYAAKRFQVKRKKSLSNAMFSRDVFIACKLLFFTDWNWRNFLPVIWRARANLRISICWSTQTARNSFIPLLGERTMVGLMPPQFYFCTNLTSHSIFFNLNLFLDALFFGEKSITKSRKTWSTNGEAFSSSNLIVDQAVDYLSYNCDRPAHIEN